jgi:hypothetical protein
VEAPFDGRCVTRADAVQPEDHFRRVVHVGVEVVVELEGPAAGSEPRALDRPVSTDTDLLAHHPVDGPSDPWVGAGSAGVAERDEGQGGVPHRGLARLEASNRSVWSWLLDGEPGPPGKTPRHDRVVDGPAQGVQRHEGVDPRRLDPTPRAVLLLPFDDPLLRPLERVSAQGPRTAPGGQPQSAVQRFDRGPAQCSSRPRRLRRGAGSRVSGIQLFEPELEPGAGAKCREHRDRHDRLTGPASEVVDAERKRPGQQDLLDGDGGQGVP